MNLIDTILLQFSIDTDRVYFVKLNNKHMLYGKLHIYPYLVLDQNANDNDYSTSLRQEVCNVEHKMIIMVIDLCSNTFLHIFIQHQHYSEHDTVCLSILFPWTVS